MKKQILLSAIFSFAAFSMFAADLTVTSASGDPTVEGSFPYIMASAQTDDVIKFNLVTDEIEEFNAITIDTKSLTIDGMNQTTGNKIKFTNTFLRVYLNSLVYERSLHDCYQKLYFHRKE